MAAARPVYACVLGAAQAPVFAPSLCIASGILVDYAWERRRHVFDSLGKFVIRFKYISPLTEETVAKVLNPEIEKARTPLK